MLSNEHCTYIIPCNPLLLGKFKIDNRNVKCWESAEFDQGRWDDKNTLNQTKLSCKNLLNFTKTAIFRRNLPNMTKICWIWLTSAEFKRNMLNLAGWIGQNLLNLAKISWIQKKLAEFKTNLLNLKQISWVFPILVLLVAIFWISYDSNLMDIWWQGP